jgi:hypothetical protein
MAELWGQKNWQMYPVLERTASLHSLLVVCYSFFLMLLTSVTSSVLFLLLSTLFFPLSLLFFISFRWSIFVILCSTNKVAWQLFCHRFF